MANIHITAQPLIPKTQSSPPSAANAVSALRAAKTKNPQLAPTLEAAASGFSNLQSSVNSLFSTLRNNTQTVTKLQVTDNTGKVIAAIGDFEYQGVVTPNYFSAIHVGDPLNTGNPALALFNAANGVVSIGQNGAVEVLDPFGNDAAWIGTKPDTLPVTGAVASPTAPLIRLTVTAHTYSTGDTPTFVEVGGVPNATGIFAVTVIDANTVDLQNSVFAGTYTSGGTGTRILHISGAANNGSGLIRIQTAVAHTYATGDEVNVVAVGGVPAADGQWVITFVDSTHYDLQGSTFSGAYTSGGTCLRYFAGALMQTIAIGPSFPSYRLRAFADGSLKISNAVITLTQGSDVITLDPSGPYVRSTDGTYQAQITGGTISIISVAGTNPQMDLTQNELVMYNTSGTAVVDMKTNTGTTEAGSLNLRNATNAVTIDPSQTVAINVVSGEISTGGDVNAGGVFRKGGVAGISPTITYGISLSLVTVSNAVRGTPGTGQSNFTAVSSVTLNTASNTFSGGIITA